MTLSDILVLSGVPGSGKTHFAQWLERRGWAAVNHDRLNPQRPLDAAWIRAYHGDDRPLLQLAGAHKGAVVEWGFHPAVDCDRFIAVAGRGYNIWYFDADHAEALRSWRRAWNGAMPDATWHLQVRRMASIWDRVRDVYGDRVLRTLEQGGSRLSEKAIYHRIFGERDARLPGERRSR